MAALHVTEAALRRERLSERDESDQVFFYVDGIPTKGRWIALELIDSWADVHLALQAAGLVSEGYGGDVLAADIEGALAKCFYVSRYDLFDLPRYVEVREEIERHDLDRDAVAAFLDWSGSFDFDSFSDSYMGKYTSEEAFAEQLVEDCGILAEVPEHIARYFDMEAFARDLFLGDYYMADGGYVFASI
jgi:hypothetical protein